MQRFSLFLRGVYVGGSVQQLLGSSPCFSADPPSKLAVLVQLALGTHLPTEFYCLASFHHPAQLP